MQACFHFVPPRQIVLKRLFDLGFAQGQHASYGISRRAAIQQSRDLIERETQLFQNQYAIQSGQWACAVKAIVGVWVDEFVSQQADLVVVAQ